jgi:hypothetical protein
MQRRDLLMLLTSAPGVLMAQLPGKGWKRWFDGRSLKGWTTQDAKPQQWTIAEGCLSNGELGKINNLVSLAEHGDIEVWIEFQIPKGSNSGVYLQGLYEVQIFDSFGKEKISTSDSGSIYHQWIDNQPVGGSVARTNAAKAPGEWQTLQIAFRAPKFDLSGQKKRNARFERVVYNGVLVHENVECPGPTRSHMNRRESPTGPLMLQGDHGPVRYRAVATRPL